MTRIRTIEDIHLLLCEEGEFDVLVGKHGTQKVTVLDICTFSDMAICETADGCTEYHYPSKLYRIGH